MFRRNSEMRRISRSEGWADSADCGCFGAIRRCAESADPKDGLILRTADVSAQFGDAQLAEFKKFAPYIVEAELGRTAVTDACFDTLRTFTHLRALHLEGTAITGSRLGELASLKDLRYLNLSGTKVTAQSVQPLKKMTALRHVYLFNTAAEGDSATARSNP